MESHWHLWHYTYHVAGAEWEDENYRGVVPLSGWAGPQVSNKTIIICTQSGDFHLEWFQLIDNYKTKAPRAATNPCWGHRGGRGTSGGHHHRHDQSSQSSSSTPTSSSSSSSSTSSSPPSSFSLRSRPPSGRPQVDPGWLHRLPVCLKINNRLWGELGQEITCLWKNPIIICPVHLIQGNMSVSSHVLQCWPQRRKKRSKW